MKINKRKIFLAFFDILCFVFIATVCFFVSAAGFDDVSFANGGKYVIAAFFLCGGLFFSRLLFGVYRTVWRYTSTQAYLRIILADIVGGLATVAVAELFLYDKKFWVFITVTALDTLMSLSARFCYRLLYKRSKGTADPRSCINIGIVGAGQLGAFLAGELLGNAMSHYRPVCFIDVDKAKIGSRIASLKVFSPEDFARRRGLMEVSVVVFALGAVDGEKRTALCDHYKEIGCRVLIYDSPIHAFSRRNGKRVIREFEIEDLLFRKPLSVLGAESMEKYRDKTVLVTGGGGSIGSELCRQIATCSPKKLVVFDIYENNAYDLQQELHLLYGDKLDLSVEIGSVRDPKRLACVFEKYKPDIVFHAAAHKHVPLMEQSAGEAIKNNVFGTYNTANAAEKYGVDAFILVSTDKAVNPTNIMGASKRLCEMVIQCRTDSRTKFAAVRFGNVLGSNGSVVPLFKRQIANGGPITITDRRIIRYFMTIPEASQLVMTAGAMAKSGELFVLDMGKPVKIYDLAVNMIRLSGLVPDVDVKIKETGLRPGEKLYEELLMKTETLDKTSNNLIFIERDTPQTRERMEDILCELRRALDLYENKGNLCAVKDAIKKTVPTFREPEEINVCAENSEEMKLSSVH